MSRPDPDSPLRDPIVVRLEMVGYISAVLGEPPKFCLEGGRHLGWETHGMYHAGSRALTVVIADTDENYPGLTVDRNCTAGDHATNVQFHAIVGRFKDLIENEF